MKNNVSKLIPALLFVLVFIGIIWRLWQVSVIPLHDWDESIYARVAWESVQNKSLETTYNGAIWLEKPPLVIYILAVVMALGGTSELWLRGTTLLFGFPLLIGLYLLSKKLVYSYLEEHKIASSNKPSRIEIEFISILPVVTLLASPSFVERLTMVNYDIPLAFGWALFFLANSFGTQLIALIVGVWSKSLLGFFPLAFEIFKLDVRKLTNSKYLKTLFNRKNFIYVLFIFIPLLWHILSFVIYGNEFIQQHLLDHLVKRITTPIELHFGGRMFYFKQLYFEYGWFIGLIAIGASIWLYDAVREIITKKRLPSYSCILFMSAIAYISFLTVSSTKIAWYLLAALPLLALLISYLALRLPNKILRISLGIIVIGFFLIKFIPETLLYQASENGNYVPAEKTQLAFCAQKLPGTSVAFLVDKAERDVQNVIEAANINIGSSFIYGGSPAFVYHSQKKVTFFYKPEDFVKAQSKFDLIAITQEDRDLLDLTKDSSCRIGQWQIISNAK